MSELTTCTECQDSPRFDVHVGNEHHPVCGRHLPRVYLRLKDSTDGPCPDFTPYRTERLFYETT